MAAIDHAAIAERAAHRLGLLTLGDLHALGLTSRQVERLVANGVLRRVGRGVYAVAAAPTSAQQRLLAATLLAGPGAVASHLAAAWLWGFDGVRPEGIELSVPRGRNPRSGSARVHRVTDLLAVDITQRGPQPITTPARTLLDIGPLVTRQRWKRRSTARDGAGRSTCPTSSGGSQSCADRAGRALASWNSSCAESTPQREPSHGWSRRSSGSFAMRSFLRLGSRW